MEGMVIWLVLIGALVGFALLAVMMRRVRLAELEKVQLDEPLLDDARIRLLEFVKRHSYSLGTWVDLTPFWKSENLRRDGDRLAVMAPLLRDAVLLVPVRSNGIDELARRAIDWFALELPRKVQLPELVFRRMYQGEPLVIESMTVAGDWVMGNQDNSVTGGNRAGRDNVGGDRVGRDKAGRDAHGATAGGSLAGSANVASPHQGHQLISSPSDLADALSALADQALARGESSEVVDALRWAATSATSGSQPNPQDQAKHQRTLDRAGDWVQAGLRAVAEGVTGALADHWLMTILQA